MTANNKQSDNHRVEGGRAPQRPPAGRTPGVEALEELATEAQRLSLWLRGRVSNPAVTGSAETLRRAEADVTDLRHQLQHLAKKLAAASMTPRKPKPHVKGERHDDDA